MAILDRAAALCSALKTRINQLPDRVLLGWITVLYFVWRIISLPPFEFGCDGVWKWSFLRYFHETGVWFPKEPEHHQGRWAQNLPNYGLMELFDSTTPWLGAVLPILTGLAVIFLVWLLARLFTSRAGAVAVILMTVCNPVFVNESSQFLPSLPSTMYLLLTLYFFMLYLKNGGPRFLPFAAGITAGLAWGCKVTASYWILGIVLFLLLNPTGGKNIPATKRFRFGWDLLLFGIGFLLIFIPETIVINKFFHVHLGRIDMLRKHHGDNPILVHFNLLEYIFSPLVIFLDPTGKFFRQGVQNALFLLAMPVAVLQLRKKDIPQIQKFMLFVMFVAMACHCYMVVSVFPFKHPERPLIRYFFTLFCIWNIIIVSCWRNILEIGSGKIRRLVVTAYGIVCIGLCILLIVNIVNDPILNQNNLFSKIRVYRCMKLHREQNLPVLVQYVNGRKFQTRTFKLIIAYETFFGKTETLPSLRERREEFERRAPLRSANDRLFFQLWGKQPLPGSTCKCVVIDDDSVRLEEITF